ncbi:MAG: DNA-3-methyladenine glycosylase family protein [Candidatus Binatia bacterium]
MISLKHKQVVDLAPCPPFDFDTSVHKPDHFPSPDNAWVPGIRWQTMLWQGERLGLKLENRATRAEPRIRLSIWSEEKLDRQFVNRLADEINYRYGLQLDLTEFNRRFRGDPQLGPLIRKWRGLRPSCAPSLYEYLMIAIVLQNCTVRRSVRMMQVLLEHYGTLLAYDGRQLYCLWEQKRINRATEEELRELKVGYRAKSIRRVTQAFVTGEIDELELRSKSLEEQRGALLGLYGIGPASVGYILCDVFHHMDELNHISPWEQKIYTKLFFNRNPEKPVSEDRLLRLFEKRFGQYKSLAVHYIWEDLFWKRKNEHIEWLEKMIRL